MTKDGHMPPESKPWRPYPSQIQALRAVADGSSLSAGGRKIGLTHQQMASRLSMCYDRLGIKEPQTHAEMNQHHLSPWRRAKAIEICKARGWWDPDEQAEE